MPSPSSTSTAASRIGKSDRLPPTTPTSGVPSLLRLAHAGDSGPSADRRRGRRPSGARAAPRGPLERLAGRHPPSAVRWPILRRSNTSPLVVEVEVDVRVGERVRDAERGAPVAARAVPSRLTIAAGPSVARRARAPGRRSRGCAARTGRWHALDRGVTAVVDPWRQLVDHERARPAAGTARRSGAPRGPSPRRARPAMDGASIGHGVRDLGGQDRLDQDAVIVDVAGRREGRESPSTARAQTTDSSERNSSSRSTSTGSPAGRPSRAQARRGRRRRRSGPGIGRRSPRTPP